MIAMRWICPLLHDNVNLNFFTHPVSVISVPYLIDKLKTLNNKENNLCHILLFLPY